MTNIEKIEDSIQRICAIIATITNMVLLHLIINKSPKKFGAYKYLMIYISVFEIIYAIDDVIIMPKLFTHGSTYLILVDSENTILPQWIIPFLTLFYVGAFGMAMVIFAVHFIFRYLVVTGNIRWTTKSTSKLLIWILVPLIYGLFFTAFCKIFMGRNEIMDAYIKNSSSGYFHINIQKEYHFGFYFYPTNSKGVKVVNWWNITGVFLATLTLLISSIVMFFFGYKCYRAVKSLTLQSSQVSGKYRTLQTQLFYALVVQTVIPLTLMHLPTSILFLFCLLDSASETHGIILSMTIAMYPAFDPLPNMFIIVDYRKAILGYFSRFRTTKRSTPGKQQIPAILT